MKSSVTSMIMKLGMMVVMMGAMSEGMSLGGGVEKCDPNIIPR